MTDDAAFKGVISHKPELVILVYDYTGEFNNDKNLSLVQQLWVPVWAPH